MVIAVVVVITIVVDQRSASSQPASQSPPGSGMESPNFGMENIGPWTHLALFVLPPHFIARRTSR